jgi:DNA-directed RNA polymerase specialized sigma24 family protein
MISRHATVGSDLTLHYFRQGSPEAFKLLFFEHYPELFSFSSMLVRHRAVAQKVTMEIFFLLWNRRADFEDEKRVKAFLYLAARNRCLQQLRAHPDGLHRPVAEATRINVVPAALPAEILRDVFSFAARTHGAENALQKK